MLPMEFHGDDTEEASGVTLEHPESPQHPCPQGRGKFPAQPFLPGAVSLL